MSGQHDVLLSDDLIVEMMIGAYERGARISLTEQCHAICMDGDVWRVSNHYGEVYGFINPTNCASCIEVKQVVREIVSDQ